MQTQKQKSSCCASDKTQSSSQHSSINYLKMSSQKECKIVFLGDKSVGKSSIAVRFQKDDFSQAYDLTIGASYIQTQINLKDQESLKIHLWDTGGDERFRAMAKLYYREAKAAIIVYDISSLDSFSTGVEYWIKELTELVESENLIIALVGNKCDLPPNEREVPTEKARAYSQQNNLIFIETSAKTGAGVQELFQMVGQEIVKNMSAEQ